MTTGRINQISIFATAAGRAACMYACSATDRGACAHKAHYTYISDVLLKEHRRWAVSDGVPDSGLCDARTRGGTAQLLLNCTRAPLRCDTSCCCPLAFHLNRAKQRSHRQRGTALRRCFPKAAHDAGLSSIGFITRFAPSTIADRPLLFGCFQHYYAQRKSTNPPTAPALIAQLFRHR